MKIITNVDHDAEFALTLEEVLGITAEMWVRIQAEYDLWLARSARLFVKEGLLDPNLDSLEK